MRCLKKNQQKIYYKQYLNKYEIVDENGDFTGTYDLAYGELQTLLANVNSGNDLVMLNEQGLVSKYDRLMIVDDINCPLTEESIVWIDRDTSLTHNYVVIKKQASLNHIVYGLKEI